MSDYAFVHEGKAYTPDRSSVPVSDVDARNKAIEQAELAAWETQPPHMLAYFKFPEHEKRNGKYYQKEFHPLLAGANVSTGLGTPVGSIIRAKVYAHNLRGRFISLRVRGTNGAEYYGRASYDRGTCIRLHKVKRS